MKTKTQRLYTALLVLLCGVMYNPLAAQTVATPTIFTTLSAGSQTVSGTSLSGTETWFRWVSDTGLVKLDVKLIDQGTSYQNVKAELYLQLSGDSIRRIYTDSLSSDSTQHLVAGYVGNNDTVFIRFVNTAGVCGSCTYAYPKVNFTIFSTLSGCAPSLPCSLVKNGGFEQSNGIACAGHDITDGVDCWYPFENSTDVYRRNCVPNSFNWNNLGVSTQNTNPPIDAHSPNPNNTVIGQYCYLNPSHLTYQGYSESVQTLLRAPLVSGHTYSLTCWLYNYSGQINNSRYSNPMSYPVNVTFGTSPGVISSVSPNTGTYSLYPIHPQITVLKSFAVAPINTWTQYTYTFTYSGAGNSNLLVGPDLLLNSTNGNVNHTDNLCLYIALDDINITDITPMSVTSATICAGQTATLTASGMNTYNWVPGYFTGSSVTYNPLASSGFTVTGTNSGGCVQTKTTSITVNPLPSISMVTPSAGICPGGNVTLSALGGVSYTWTPCSQPSNCNTNALVVSPTTNTTYTVTGFASGCTNTATANVYILNPNNSITIGGYNIICQGDLAYLSASGATNYTWSPCLSGCNTATLAPSPSVTTTYTVRGINACGVLSTSTVEVSVMPTFPVDPAVLSNPVCPGFSVALIANGGSPYSYTWTPGNTVGTLITVSPTVTTTYTACTNVPNCPNVCAAITVTVKPVPQLTLTPSSFTLCAGTPTTISVSGATSYTWITGNTGSSITVTPTATTVYTVTGEVENCAPVTATSTAYVYPSLTVTAAPNVTACPGANTSLTAFGGTGSYTWSPGGATTASVIVTPTAPTVYTVSSSNGVCTLTTTILVNPVICCSVATTSLFTATSGTVSGGTYVLNSPLTLTGGLILSHVTIFMGTNAEIIIPNGMTLGLSTTHLLGCPQMWKGIRCTGSNASVYMVKSTLIEDAITAIDVANVTAPSYSTSILFLENSTFNKNYTSVNVENFDATAEHFPMFMGDMVFTSRKLITPDHLLLNPSLTVNYNWPVAANVPELKSITYFPATFNPDVNLQTGYEFSVASYSTANCEVPYSNSVAHQGIRVKNVYSTSNYNGFRMEGYNAPGHFDSFLFHNLFDNMHYGVNVTNSNFYACSSIYQYMSQYLVSYDPNFPKIKTYDGGVGINQVNTLATGLNGSQTFSMAVGPYTLGMNKTTNFFFNNPYGIKTENMQYATIAYNVFHSNRVYSTSPGPISIAVQVDRGQYGIYMKSVDYRNVNITQNFAANINNGIVFLANSNPIFGNLYAQMAGTVNIQYNRLKGNYGASITAGQSMAQAIAVDNLITPLLMNYANNITVPLTIRNNTIALAFNGIAATNWNGQQVVNKINTISLIDNGFNGTSQYGIRHANNLADNVFGNTITGFNTTKVRVHGIYAAENKSQSVWCNSTENSYYGIVFAGSQNLTSWKSNTMKTHVQAMRLDNTTIGQQGGSGSPIANVWAGSWASGTYKLFVNGIDPGTVGGNSKLYMIAGVMPSVSESDATPLPTLRYKTSAPQSLFTTTGFSTVDCPASYSVSAAHNFPFLKANLGNIVTDAYDYSTYLNGNRKNGKLAVYRALMTDTSLVATDTILQQFKAASDVGTIGKFFALEQYLADGDLSNAENTLATISPADTVEYVLKRFYSIYFNSKTGAYDAADESDLITLATACPQQMGVGVYQARVLLNSLYDVYETYESDCGDTNNVAARKGRNSTKELSNMIMQDNFLVYPNPSDGIVYFTASNMGIASYQVMVYDIHGKCIFIKQYADGEKVNALDLDLSNGIYLMQLTDNSNGDVYQQKFVIQK